MLEVTDPCQITSARDEVANDLKGAGLTGLVNNAGIPLSGPLEFLSIPDFRYELEVNLIGAVAVTQAFLPMIRQAHGRIINMSSLSGFIALPFMSPYAATKFGLRAITDSLRVEVRPWGIFVSIIEVGDVNTPLWANSQEVIEKAAREMPERGWELYGPIVNLKERFQPHGIRPAEVAKVVKTRLDFKETESQVRGWT